MTSAVIPPVFLRCRLHRLKALRVASPILNFRPTPLDLTGDWKRPLPPRRGHDLRGALSFLATVFTDDTTPCPKALGRMLLHPVGKLRRAYQAGLH